MGIGVAFNKRFDLVLPLRLENGAGAVQQSAARTNQWPKLLE
jgi:hypothetical protein